MEIGVKIIEGARLAYFIATVGTMGFFFAYVLATPLYLLSYFFSPARNVADRVMRQGVRSLFAVQPWFKAEIDLQLPNAKPGQGRLLVSNHRSHLDAFILLSQVAGVRIFAKRALFRVPFLGWMMHMMHQIPVERASVEGFWKAIDIVRKQLRNGETVHVFPEMTRCSQDHVGTLDFSAAPFLAAIQEKAIVVPIAFTGTDSAWPKGRTGIRANASIQARVLTPLDPKNFSSADEMKREARRLIEGALV